MTKGRARRRAPFEESIDSTPGQGVPARRYSNTRRSKMQREVLWFLPDS